MNWKQWVLAAAAAFVLLLVTSFVIHGLLLSSTYERLTGVFRETEKLAGKKWLLVVASLLYAGGFAYFYGYGAEAKPWAGQGLRFGIGAALAAWVPLALVSYVYFRIPYTVALGWIVAGGVQFVLMGLAIAAVYRVPGAGAPAESGPASEA